MNNDQTQMYDRMTHAPIKKLIVKLAKPTIVSMLVTSFYNMADTFFVGRINTSATAAVGIAFSLMAVIQAFGFLFGQGSGNYISRQLGAKHQKEANTMASTGFFSAFIFGLLLSILGIFFIEPLAVFLGSTKTILPYAIDYIKIILIGAPFMTSSLVLNNQLRFQGNAFYAMIGIVSGAAINIVLDPILIFNFNMGIAGAAFATIISQIISFFILLIQFKRSHGIELNIKNFSFSFYYYKEILRGGIPSLLRQGFASVAMIVINYCVGVYGDAAIAAFSIVNRITTFIASAVIGFGQGFQPVCGFNYGAKRYDRVTEGFWFCVKVVSVFLVIFSSICFIFSKFAISIFRDDTQVIEIGVIVLRYSLITFPITGYIMMANMLLQTMGKAKEASILSMARQGLFLIPIILLLTRLNGLSGAQLSQPISDIFTFITTVLLCTKVLKTLNIETE